MKKLQYISPACKVINVNVESRFLQFSAKDPTRPNDIGQGAIGADTSQDFDVKGDGGFWDEW